MRAVRILLLGCLFFLPLVALALELKPDHPESYKVKKGDTLWDIAGAFLDEPWLWPKLWYVNPAIVNPDLIYPGDVITLVWADGKPSLQVSQESDVNRQERKAVPSVDMQAIAPYFRTERLIEQSMLDTSARIIGTNENDMGWYSDSTMLYSDKVLSSEQVAIYRIGEAVTRELANGKKVTAYRAVKVAAATQKPLDNGIAQLHITKIRQEIARDDVVLPNESPDEVPAYFTLNPAPEGVQAVSLGGTDARSFLATRQVTLLNVGAKDGVVAGDMMRITLPNTGLSEKGRSSLLSKERKASSLVLPNKVIGEAVIFKTYDYFSYAMITKSSEPVTSNALFIAPSTPEAIVQREQGTQVGGTADVHLAVAP